MRLCDWFDRYRDGELGATQREQFRAHLAACLRCRERMALIESVVLALKPVPVDVPLGFPERTARRAMQYHSHWDTLVVSMLRPAPAVIALIIVILIFSTLWWTSGANRAEVPGEYEALVNETYSLIPGSSVGQVHMDDDLFGLLEQEGGVQ